MTKPQVYLLIAAFAAVGAFSLYVRLGEREPEVIANALICPDCGKPLSKMGEPCVWCRAKKTREQIEAAARGEPARREPARIAKAVLGAGSAGVLLGIVVWPYIRSRLHARSQRGGGGFFSFHCPHCGRKLRYSSASAGSLGLCPKCRRMCKFPEADPDAAG